MSEKEQMILSPFPLSRPLQSTEAQRSPFPSPIEIETMGGLKNQDKLIHAMAWEAANVHLGTPRAAARILSDLNGRSSKQLRTAVKEMAAIDLVHNFS